MFEFSVCALYMLLLALCVPLQPVCVTEGFVGVLMFFCSLMTWLGGRASPTELPPRVALYRHICLSMEYLGFIHVPFAAAQCLISHLIVLRISI